MKVKVIGLDGKPLEGAEVTIRDRDGTILFEGKTDKCGMVEVKEEA